MSCEAPAAPKPPGFHTTGREPKRAHLRVPAFKNTIKIQREDTQRETKRAKVGAGEGKQKRNFGRSGVGWSSTRRSGAGGSGETGGTGGSKITTPAPNTEHPTPNTQHDNNTTTTKWIGQKRIGQNWIGQVGWPTKDWPKLDWPESATSNCLCPGAPACLVNNSVSYGPRQRNGHDRLWPFQFWPIHFWPSCFAGQFWPIHFWPKLMLGVLAILGQ